MAANFRLFDQTAAVRAEEQLDQARLDAFLRAHVPGLAGDLVLEQFPGGHSNLTYLARYGARELVIRRPPVGNTVKGAHDMGREYTVLSRIYDRFAPAPQPLAYCEEAVVLGAPFYVMERIRGVIFRAQQPKGYAPQPEEVHACCDAFVRGLADIHALDWRAAGLDSLYKGPGYLARQVRGWAARWKKAKTEDVAAMDRAGKWLAEKLPPDTDATLIHNDYKFDNLIFDVQDIGHLVGVLDWEMATIGDPLSDFATTLGGFFPVSTEASKTVAQCWLIREPGAYTPADLCEAYARYSGRDLGNLLYYVVFAQYKGAVIVQQIYARYARGHTQDERFATLGALARTMARNADALIARGQLNL